MLTVGYIVGFAMLLLGALILFGFFQFRDSLGEGSDMLRTMFGIVLMLYGIYRLAMSETARRQKNRGGGH
jgi:uncharacterized membrane protein HdeD (DUF308 family)